MALNVGVKFQENVLEKVSEKIRFFLTGLQSIQNNTSSSTLKMQIKFESSTIKCNSITMNQQNTNHLNVIYNISDVNLKELKTEIAKSFEETIKDITDQDNDGLNVGQLNINANIKSVTEKIKNIQDTTLKSFLTTEFNQDQNNTITFDWNVTNSDIYCDDLTVQQSSQIQQIASSTITKIDQLFDYDQSYTELKKWTEDILSQQNKGLDALSITFIIVGSILAVGVIAYIYYKLQIKNINLFKIFQWTRNTN